ncbi:MAG: PHP domain-containing protein [Candidatus Competibacteraceae bacterium]|nr:PHP domain-containing protein [Candidatus Competibacteraceae bacterium]
MDLESRFPNSSFVHWHSHTEYSAFDGLAKVTELAKSSRRMGFPALAITDHGTIGGWIKFFKDCTNPMKDDDGSPLSPIKPILGCEVYLARKHEWKSKDDAKTNGGFQADGRKGNRHLTVYAQNFKGYQNLCALTEKAWVDGYYYKDPRIDIELLAKHSEGLIVGSACLSSLINANLLHDRYDKARKACILFKDIFKENFFLEVMYHGIPDEARVIPDIFKLSAELNIPVCATNDNHYIYKDQGKSQEVLMCISTSNCLTNPKHIHFPYEEFYLKSAAEMARIFGKVPQSLYNSVAMAERIDAEDIKRNLFGGMRLPKFDLPKFDVNEAIPILTTLAMKVDKLKSGETYKEGTLTKPMEYLCYLAFKGLHRRNWQSSGDHKRQLIKELIDVWVAWENNSYDFATYFLIVEDYISWARKKGIIAGFGRGCLSGDEPVLTDSGSVTLKDVTTNHQVLTKSGNYEQVLDTHKYECSEDLISINAYFGGYPNVKLTSDHKVWVDQSSRPNNWDKWKQSTKNSRAAWESRAKQPAWIAAKDIKEGDWVYQPRPSFSRKPFKSIDLAEFVNNDENILVREDVLQEIRRIPIHNTIRSVKNIKRNFPLNSILYWVLGKFAADGWFRSGKKGHSSIGFAFHKNEVDQVDKVEKFFTQLGCVCKINTSKTRKLIQLEIKSRLINRLFRKLFDSYESTSCSKHIPELVFCNDDLAIADFVAGAFAGDGCIKNPGKYVYTSVSRRLACEMQELLRRLNVPSNMLKEKRRDSYSVMAATHPVVRLGSDYFGNSAAIEEWNSAKSRLKNANIEEDGIWVRVRKIEITPTDGFVYDLTVANESNYTTTSFNVHNSGYGSILLHCLGIANGIDPLKFGLLWERFLGFDDLKFVKESDFGFEQVIDLSQMAENDDIDEARDVEDDLGGVDRY